MTNTNKNILSTEVIRGELHITYNGKSTPIIVPTMVGGIDIPLIDPYDPHKDNGCMVPNKISFSKLSTYAKQAFTVLRSHLYYGTGFTFITMDTLAEGMSCTRQKASDAINELVFHGVIRVEHAKRKGINKNYFAMTPSKEWRLPEKKGEWKKVAVKLRGESDICNYDEE